MVEEPGSTVEARRPWPTLAMLAAVGAWLWPLGVGGRMPIGGDVTRFQLGLMAELGRAIRAGRLPLWIDTWGYGFPGVGEGQMGAFYPPHWLLYGPLSAEAAYTASLVLHTVWAALGASWAARRFGCSPWGSALAGCAWSASGFFLIHLQHQWAYTSGSWMPWAWGLAWPLARGVGSRRDAWGLAVVLALQVLAGHFQLAFFTQVALAGMAVWALVERPTGTRSAIASAVIIMGSVALAAPLAAAQLGPTWRLARLAAARRDFEYLSGFATTPMHLVSLLAPGLFRGTLWRPVAWDPFRASPEEHLLYVGLVPLLLALGAIRRGFRLDPAVRLLAGLLLGSLLLSLGPYVPGFSALIRLPGFSFFRCPARWGLATSLALAILAAKGFDAWPSWPRPGKAVARFALLALAAPLLVVLGFELALASTDGAGWPAVASAFEAAIARRPETRGSSFVEIMVNARRPQSEYRTLSNLAREGYDTIPPAGLRLDRERFAMYSRELHEAGLIALALLVLAPFAQRRRSVQVALLALTATDLLILGRHRVAIDDIPMRPLTAQSRVLARLAAEPPGTRLAGEIGNLPMVAGMAPVDYSRTLDLPALSAVTYRAGALVDGPAVEAAFVTALRATGSTYRLFNPYEVPPSSWRNPEATIERIDDPALASWTFGEAWSRNQPNRTTYSLWRANAANPPRAWFAPDETNLSDLDPAQVLKILKSSVPLMSRILDSRHQDIDVHADRPGWVIVSTLFDPEWHGQWSGPNGEHHPSSLVRAFGGWQAARVPSSGTWTLHLSYQGRDVKMGLAVSGFSWLLMLAAWFRLGPSTRGYAAPA